MSSGFEIGQLQNGKPVISNFVRNAAPASGTLNGIAPKGSLVIDIVGGGLYQNTGTMDATTWGQVTNSAVSLQGQSGQHTVTSTEGAATTVTIATGVTTASSLQALIIRSGKQVSSDPAISFSAGGLTIAAGSSYVLTTSDVINWIVTGT